MPNSTTYHRQLSSLLKHTQPNRWWGFCLELLTMINYIIYIMQTGSKPGHYIPLPLGITLSSVFHYIHTIHIQFSLQNFKIADLFHVQSSTLNVHDQAARLPWTCPTGSQLQLILKSRNFATISLFMFPRWEILA